MLSPDMQGGMLLGKTNLAGSIETTDELVRRYNENVCNILADPQILGYILINTMTEFRHWELSDIIDSIGDVRIRNTMVDPGYSNYGKLVGEQNVDLVPGEGEVRYDIRFSVHHGKEQIKILLNVEAQKTTDSKKLSYHIENRVQYYLARMLSAQKNTEFFHSDYDNIKKVVSIWICMDAENDMDGITRYAFAPENIYGQEVPYSEFDKMEAYIIRIRESEDIEASKNKLVHMLETLLSTKPKQDVVRILEKEHNMVMNVEDTGLEVNNMCNLGEALYERAEKKGIELGIEQGLERGTTQTLISMITRKMKKGKTAMEIAEDLDEELSRIQPIYDVAGNFEPDYDVDAIYNALLAEREAVK